MNLPELGLSFIAGVLSILSPCVLPLLPIVFASALQAGRWGALALASGLTVSFTAVGLLLATVGASIGLDAEVLRELAGVMLLLIGAILAIPPLQNRVSYWTSMLAGRAGHLTGRVRGDGIGGQLAIGGLLGLIWTPCVGPTLGAAATLASQGKDLAHVAIVMLMFGLGAAVPLAVIGTISRQTLNRSRGRLMHWVAYGKAVLGVLLVLIGFGILSGYDRLLEAFLVAHSPAWLTDLTTRY